MTRLVEGESVISENRLRSLRLKAASLILVSGLFAAHSAHAWFFFIIPLPRSQAALLNNEVCVGENVKVGDRTTGPNGATIEIQSVVGQVAFCHNTPNTPVLAKFVTVPSSPPPSALPAGTQPPAQVESSNSACVPAGTGPGDRTTVGDKQVEIVRIVRRGPPCDSRPEAPIIAEYREVPPAPVAASAGSPTKSIVVRLRELKQLRDENLITQEVYEAKQREILAGQ